MRCTLTPEHFICKSSRIRKSPAYFMAGGEGDETCERLYAMGFGNVTELRDGQTQRRLLPQIRAFKPSQFSGHRLSPEALTRQLLFLFFLECSEPSS